VATLEQVWNAPGEPVVDVIVPIYHGRDETLRCLYSVLAAAQKTPYRLVVVDDHSPDIELRMAMEKLSARGFIELYKTPANQGFVAACNLGMRLAQFGYGSPQRLARSFAWRGTEDAASRDGDAALQ
jgi:GT2 family glycosyltransferase